MSISCKHIIWDWNGTLLDDTSLCVEVLNDLLTGRGMLPITEAVYRQKFGFPVVEFYNWLGFETGEEHFQKLSRQFMARYEARWLEECALHPETAQVLSYLIDRGLTHSVLSAAKQEALDIGIEHFGIRHHFTGLMGADNIYAKGKVEQGQHWIKQLPWGPDEIVLIGDTLHDFEVSAAIGTRCILLDHGHHTSERLAESGVPVVSSFNEIVELVI